MNKFSLFIIILIILNACQNNQRQSIETVNSESIDSTTEADYYQEKHRPQFHFSPSAKWMNDPNGMVYYEGEYHLFYQYYPDSTVWGPMHWGHAISPDLVHWEHLPIALYPDELGYIFSGSAVVDWKNTSGFGKDGVPPLVAIFTHHEPKGAADEKVNDFQYQSIAYSNDKGRTWTKYEGNPVVPNVEKIRDFRDPKVVWDEDSNQWLMVFAAYDHVKFYGSPNLKHWSHLSDWGKEYGGHGGVWECPELYPTTVEGTGEKKWVLLQSLNPGSPNGGSGTQYFIGDFDGKEFNIDPEFAKQVTNGKGVWLDYGRDNYAGVTFSDIPESDGRRIFMGWMSNWDYAQVVPTEKWRSANTIPRQLILQDRSEGYRVVSLPVKELEQLRGKSVTIPLKKLSGKFDIEKNFNPELSEIILSAENPSVDSRFGIQLSNDKGEIYRIGYDVAKNQYFSDRMKAGTNKFSEKFAKSLHFAPRLSSKKTIQLQVFFDVSSVELFADGGVTVLTDIFFPTEKFDQISLFSEKGDVQIQGKGYELDAIW
jgi:fructan beta-fructosidase